MPINTSIRRDYPSSLYPAPRKYVLVLSCVDCRLLDDLVRFLDHDNLANRYYHATFAGASLGLVCPKPESVIYEFSHWRKTFIDHVQATVELTAGKLTDIYIIQHENCGAFALYYRGFRCMSNLAQFEVNRQLAVALQRDICENFCKDFNPTYPNPVNDSCETPIPENCSGKAIQKAPPIVHAFFMDLRGNVKLLSPPLEAQSVCPNHWSNAERAFNDVSSIDPESGWKKRARKK